MRLMSWLGIGMNREFAIGHYNFYEAKEMRITRLRLLASIVSACLLTGCVNSVHPLYTEGETVFREELVGDYELQVNDEASPTIWKVESIADEAYRVTLPSEGGLEGDILIMHLVELDDQLYMDVYGLTDEGEIEPSSGHMIARVRLEEDVAVTTAINNNWLTAYLAEHPEELAVTQLEDRPYVTITAETEDLQRFIIAHAEEGLFEEEVGTFEWKRRDPAGGTR